MGIFKQSYSDSYKRSNSDTSKQSNSDSYKLSYSDKYKLSYSDTYNQSYSDLFRVSIDPRVKPEGDRKESVPEGDRKESVPEGDERGKKPEGNNYYIVMPRFGTNRPGIFELIKNIKLSLRGACLRATWQSQQNANNQPRCSRQSLGLPQHDNLKKSSHRAVTRGQAIFELVFFTLVSSTSIAQAECVPLPDCASIGYTETSCEGGFVRCPFDTSKLLCIPCDTKYKYACSGTGQIGSGESCNGKYTECTCTSGYEWNGSACEVEVQDCDVGYIYYSDKTCSSSYNSSKTAIGVVVKKNELIVALNVPDMYWANSYVDVSGITNTTTVAAAKADYNGKANTLAIVSTYTSDTTSNNAAIYCNKYTTAGTSAGQWYLPALGEVSDYIDMQYTTIKSGWDKVGTTISDSWFWSSSEYGWQAVWGIGCPAHTVIWDDKDEIRSVGCFLDISSL